MEHVMYAQDGRLWELPSAEWDTYKHMLGWIYHSRRPVPGATRTIQTKGTVVLKLVQRYYFNFKLRGHQNTGMGSVRSSKGYRY
jgi:hypothetical protein